MVYIIMILVVTACHKEFVKYPENSLESKVVLALKKQIPAADFEQLDLYQIEKINHPAEEVLACKVPFIKRADSVYSFVLVNIRENNIGAIYRNDIAYTSLHGGNFPVSIRNLNYATGVLQEYSVRSGLKTTSPDEPLINRLGIPAVTTSGVYAKSAADGAERLTAIESYIFCGLLGLASVDAAPAEAQTFKRTKLKVHYFNPYSRNEEGDAEAKQTSFLEWDVQLR